MPDFESIKRRVRVEEVVRRVVRLRRQGTTLVGRCPFHEDRGRPNLVVFPRTETYCCFVCGAQGDAVDFLARYEGIGQVEAAERLAEGRERSAPAAAEAQPARDAHHLDVVYRLLLGTLDLSDGHRAALLGRGLPDGAILSGAYRTLGPGAARRPVVDRLLATLGEGALWGAPGFGLVGRRWRLLGPAGLLVPVRDADGRVVALQVRVDGSGAKYRWLSSPGQRGGASSGSPVHVAGREHGTETVWLTEGPLKADVLASRLGVCAVAVAGVSLWRRAGPAVDALGSRTVVLAFDQDDEPATAEAVGRHTRAAAQALGSGRRVRLASWDKGKGIDDALALGAEVTLT